MIRARFLWLAGVVIVVAGGAIMASQHLSKKPALVTPSTLASAPAMDADEVKREAVCRRVGRPVIPAADRPTPEEAVGLKDCDAESLYYGEGTAPDYVKARQCAVLDSERGENDFFFGNTILMQLYANGQGTPRNNDLATALACSDDIPHDGKTDRVLRLQSMAAKPVHFDICDDVVTDYGMAACAARDSRVADSARNRKIDALMQGFPAAAAPLFADVRTAFDAYVESHANDEVDHSGTIGALITVGERDGARDQFVKDLTRLADGTWPPASSDDAQAADKALNQGYAKALKVCPGDAEFPATITPDIIRATQKAWLIYRDAYVKFATVAAPAVTQDAVLARLTKLRTAELDSLECGEDR